jgi:glutathione S-transferase
MKLYYSPASPFVRKVTALAQELGIAGRIALLPASGTAVDPGTMPVDKNPLGKLPTLITTDGRALYDSRVICRYLDSQFAGGFYPNSRIWDILTLEATADGMLEAALLMVYEARIRPAEICYAPWVEGQWVKVARGLDMLESDWTLYLKGPVDMGHIAIGCMLGYLDFRHAGRDWRAGHPKLAAWEAGFAQRPAMLATIPKA